MSDMKTLEAENERLKNLCGRCLDFLAVKSGIVEADNLIDDLCEALGEDASEYEAPDFS